MSGTSVAPRAARSQAAASRRRRLAAFGAAAGAGLAAVGLFACYLRQSRTVAVGSDGASQALQAWDLLHGNLLLHGWWMTDVSFYPTEIPQYALIELVRGLDADVIHVAGAMTYTLLVLSAALLARGRVAGRTGLIRAALAAGIMLAPQLGPGTATLLLSPDHTGTGVPVLLVFLLIDHWLTAGDAPGDRGPARRPTTVPLHAGHRRAALARPLLVWAGLTGAAVADTLAVFIAVIPLALVCAVRLAATLAARRPGRVPGRPAGLGPEPGRPVAGRPETSLGLAALAAVPAALAVTALIRAQGGYQVNGLRTALAGAGQLAGNARLAGEGLLELFGADVFSAPPGTPTALAAVHLAGAAVAVAGTVLAARTCLRRDGWRCPGRLVEQALLAGIVIDVAAYVAGVQAVNILSTREIVPVLPFAAVLAGRSLGGPLAAARPAWRAGACALLAVQAAGLGYAAAAPPAAAQDAALASWLRAHHLTSGLSGYHQANIVTLASGGAVTLRAVTPVPGGRLAGYDWNASAAWFGPAARPATFLVLAGPGTSGSSGVTAARAVATFGRPAARYQFEGYQVLVWPPHRNLLANLRAGQSGGAAASK